MTVATLTGFGLVMLAGSVAISLAVPAFVRNRLTAQADQASREVTTLIDRARLPGPIPPQNGVLRLQIVGADGTVKAASATLQGRPAMSGARPHGHDSRVTERICEDTDEYRCLIVVGTSNRATAYGPVMVYAAVPESRVLSTPVLPFSLLGLSAALLTLIGWATWIGVGRVLAPVERIRSGLAEISAADLSERMPVPATGDEVEELAVTVNETLNRLEDAVERHRRFVSDASHELRTPITALLARLDVALTEPDQEDLRETLRSAVKDTERLGEIVSDLLMLARLDAGTAPPETFLDVGELVAEDLGRRPSRLPITSELEPDLIVRGNLLRLDRLMTNLLSNADRYGRSSVHVTVRRVGDEAEVQVRDDGPGIPPDQRDRVFQRFTRLDAARSRDAGGTGLGLPIARDIATAHGGRLYVGDDGPAACLILRLPLVETDPA